MSSLRVRSVTRRTFIAAVLGSTAFAVTECAEGADGSPSAGARATRGQASAARPTISPGATGRTGPIAGTGATGATGATGGVGADRPPASGSGGTAAAGPASGSAPSGVATSEALAEPVSGGGLQLPRGGRVLFPTHRLVGYSGGPGSAAFGRLGVGDLDARVLEIERLGAVYAAGRRPLPVLELIAVVAQPRPGRDGRYRVRVEPEVVRTYLAAARRHRALLLLNIQPGRARFLDEVAALEPWLRQPDVGVALDPEWAVRSGQVPGRVFGRTTGSEIDAVAAYLSRLVVGSGLPQKPLVVHQLAPQVVSGLSAVRLRPEVAVIKSVDGIGPPAAKTDTWTRLMTGNPAGVHPGFKLFFSEDRAGHGRLMTPAEVMALRPTPEYVLYE